VEYSHCATYYCVVMYFAVSVVKHVGTKSSFI